MISLSPQQLFIRSLPPDANFKGLVKMDLIQRGFAAALGQMATEKPTQEELAGANRLVSIFLNLAESDTQMTPLLFQSIDRRTPTQPASDAGNRTEKTESTKKAKK